jgi:hypothetical protein
MKRVSIWFYALLFTGAYGSIDSINAHAPFTSKNYLTLFVASGLAIAVLLRLSGDDSSDPVYDVEFNWNPFKCRIRKLR